MLVLVMVGVVVVLAAGVAAGAWVRGRLLLPSDQKRLGVLASELHTQARMDAMSRAIAQAMRDAVRRQ